MNNSFFSLIIVPDSGSEVKTGSFNAKVILGFFSLLFVAFFICLFFIIGYHIKLSQEKNYKSTVSTHKNLLNNIENSENLLHTLLERTEKIQRNDKAFRLFNSMSVIDNEMYKAGIGGHVIVDDSEFSTLSEGLHVSLKRLTYSITSLDRRIFIGNKSLGEIQSAVQINMERMNNTPSIRPTLSIRITSSFGWRSHPLTGRRDFHGAVDLAGTRGQQIVATAEGIVTFAGRRGRLGKCIVIKHKYGYETLYSHLGKIVVKVGQKIKKREPIGTMGRTGRTTGVHVHYGISLNNRAQNPLKYF